MSKYKNLDYANYYNQLQTNKVKNLQNYKSNRKIKVMISVIQNYLDIVETKVI